MIRIVAFETREDELIPFSRMKDFYDAEITCTDKVLNKHTLSLLENTQAISILGHSKLNRDMLFDLKNRGIYYVSTRTMGYNHIDLTAAAEFGIRVANARYAPNGVADYTVMLILMSLRKYKQAMWRANVNDYSLFGLQGREMRDLTIGIVGTGNIGAQVIRNLSGFGCRIIAFDTRVNQSIEQLVDYVSLDELYSQADVISFHVPLLDSTFRMVSKQSLKKMKDGVILINCSRGELMHIGDVIDAIESRKIGALAMDVFENETGIYHLDRRTDIISNRDMAYIRQFPNVIMTQHIAFYTDTAVAEMVECGVKSLVDFATTGSSPLEIRM